MRREGLRRDGESKTSARGLRGLAVLGVAAAMLLAGAARVHADPLLDLLHDKKILTDQELERVKSAPLPAAERAALVDVLRSKGVLTADEAAHVRGAATTEAGRMTAMPVAAAPASAMARQAAAALQQQGDVAATQQGATAAAQPSAGAPAPSTKGAAPVQVGYDDGFFVRSADGNFALRWNGRAVTNFVADEPGTAVRDTFSLDRARLGADATFYKYFRGRVEGEFASSSVLRDAYVALQPRPEFNVQIGQFPVPFGYELTVSKLRTDFVDRAAVVTQAVNSRRDIGVMAYGAFLNKMLQYQLAVMNGSGQNRADNNSDKDFVGRVVVAPFVNSDHAHLKGLNVGGSVTYGRQPAEFAKDAAGTLKPVANSVAGTSETGFTFFPAIPRRGARLRGAAHVAWLDGPASITSEYIHTSEERNGLGTGGSDLSDLETDGGYVGASWLLTGETKPYGGRVRPLRPLWTGTTPGWGAWELALRYEFFKLRHDADSASPALNHNRYDAGLAGINWYPSEFLRLSLDYVYSVYDQTGTNASPDPDEHSDNAVLGRAQVDF